MWQGESVLFCLASEFGLRKVTRWRWGLGSCDGGLIWVGVVEVAGWDGELAVRLEEGGGFKMD